jgi:8-oxo-dGTP diphosphatase
VSGRIRVPCVGALISDGEGRLLLVQRGNAPYRGRWSLPGGRCEPDEPAEQAVVREVREETHLEVEVDRLLTTVERDDPSASIVYVIDEFACLLRGGRLQASDDALAARWTTAEQRRALVTTPGLLDVLDELGY